MRRADRFQVVLHVGLPGHDTSGLHVSAETSRRLACDAGLVLMAHDPEGRVLDVGRKSRTVPSALRRALEARGPYCRFPGCEVRHTEAHHIRHWADGGRTDLDNLVLLCRRHHRLVHEGRWTVRLDRQGEAAFRRPDGRTLPRAPGLPGLPSDPVGTLLRRYGSPEAETDPWLTTPRWNGERLDLGFAVESLRGLG